MYLTIQQNAVAITRDPAHHPFGGCNQFRETNCSKQIINFYCDLIAPNGVFHTMLAEGIPLGDQKFHVLPSYTPASLSGKLKKCPEGRKQSQIRL